MRAKQPLLLLHPVFLVSVGLLLLNDFYLKYTWHNWMTGKLSDFAGLFAFSVFFVALFPANKKIVLLLAGSFFLWWKSSLSGPLIFILNTDFTLPVYRTIDYSDYLAIVMIPLAYHLKPMPYSRGVTQTIATWLVGIISFFSFTATSMIRKLADSNRVELDKYVHTKKNENEIVSSLEQEGLKPTRIPAIYERDWGRKLYVRAPDKFGDTVLTALDKIYPELYRKIDYGSVYNIPVMYIRGDSIYNLQFVISGENGKRRDIWLHSFEYRMQPDTTVGGMPYNPLEFSSHQVSKKFGKPVRKRIKQIIKNK